MVLFVAAERCETVSRLAPVLVMLFDLIEQRRMGGEGVQQVTLGIAFHQGLVGMLAVNINQIFPQCFQDLQRDRAAVNKGAGRAVRADHPARQDFIPFRLQGLLFQQGGDGGVITDMKYGRDLGAVGTGPDHG